MRRLLTFAATVAALSVAIFVGPMGTAAAGPYVFGCAALGWEGFGGTERAALTIYNGSASTANLTHKVLAGDGTILNAGLLDVFSMAAPLALTSTLSPTKTATFNWADPLGSPSSGNSTVQNSVRIVSDVPVAVAVQINGPSGVTVSCTDLRP